MHYFLNIESRISSIFLHSLLLSTTMHWSKQHTSSSAKRSALCQMMPLSWVAALDFTFQQASYAKFILGHALASGSHCKSIPVKYPVCYQTSCNGNYFVPPEFPDDNEVVESSIKNSLLYALTVLILCLGCCGICGLIFTWFCFTEKSRTWI